MYSTTTACVPVETQLDCTCCLTGCCFWWCCQIPLKLACISPLSIQGFGVAAKSTQECRHADATAIVAFHQADVGQYLRLENNL